ncbi:hypothetical protein EXIGLDRAFT_837722 [Exidia glandulosa HHB12029]|uniref:Ricin B lectin domain-containing protein n=1 Tax=Exidia glandulosa HHB12029 TaxID=1314781 RepID=A0A166AC85_EXIGL|nr:hypothetical protein EXIGLDRAFT_837722 [Exidia glandulosa HHB12029]
MFSFLSGPFLLVSLLIRAATAQSPGIYRFSSVQFAQLLLSQSGPNIQSLGGNFNGDPAQTWFLSPTTGGLVTIQNAGTFQYLSLPEGAANNTVVVPSNIPFAWTFGGNGVSFGNLWLTSLIGPAVGSVTVTTGPPSASRQRWQIGAVTPYASYYRVWNTDTNTVLTAGAPSGPLSASPSDPTNAAQLWRLSGTGPGSNEGTLQNVKTGAYLTILDGQPTISSDSGPQWFFSTSGGGARLSTFGGSPPNVLTVDGSGAVTVDTSGTAGTYQIWTFVPTNPSNAH